MGENTPDFRLFSRGIHDVGSCLIVGLELPTQPPHVDLLARSANCKNDQRQWAPPAPVISEMFFTCPQLNTRAAKP